MNLSAITSSQLLALLDPATAETLHAELKRIEPSIRKNIERLIGLAYAKGAQDAGDSIRASYIEFFERAQRECATITSSKL